MRATVSSNGVVTRALKQIPDRTTTAEDVKDPEKLARTVQELRASALGEAERKELTFHDVSVSTAGALVKLPHNFGGRVHWSLVDWASTVGGAAPILEKSTTTDDNTLVLASYVAGTASIRIEAV